jgi:hypothetical protein
MKFEVLFITHYPYRSANGSSTRYRIGVYHMQIETTWAISGQI